VVAGLDFDVDYIPFLSVHVHVQIRVEVLDQGLMNLATETS
jgi:hypothetical protein